MPLPSAHGPERCRDNTPVPKRGQEEATPRACVALLRPPDPDQVPEPFHRDGWVYEEKVDGWRILAYKGGPRVRLVSRT
jgi:ATP-dependent DNA ligase